MTHFKMVIGQSMQMTANSHILQFGNFNFLGEMENKWCQKIKVFDPILD